jgi:antirestriction protein ArdC
MKTLNPVKQETDMGVNDIYARVTQKIIDDMQKGQLTWRKPWGTDNCTSNVIRPRRYKNMPFTGINTILLWDAANEKGYTSPYWMTYDQASALNGQVRRGEKGTQVVQIRTLVVEEKQIDNRERFKKIPFLRKYSVFNANQIDGLPMDFYQIPKPTIGIDKGKFEKIELFVEKTKAKIVTGAEALYDSSKDRIEMPPVTQLKSAQAYYATLAHELNHWTGHPARLNRNLDWKQFSDITYAKEELVAELGTCFLGADLGFAPKKIEQHDAHVQFWLAALKKDKRLIFRAASNAQSSLEYLHSLQKSPIQIQQPKRAPALIKVKKEKGKDFSRLFEFIKHQKDEVREFFRDSLTLGFLIHLFEVADGDELDKQFTIDIVNGIAKDAGLREPEVKVIENGVIVIDDKKFENLFDNDVEDLVPVIFDFCRQLAIEKGLVDNRIPTSEYRSYSDEEKHQMNESIIPDFVEAIAMRAGLYEPEITVINGIGIKIDGKLLLFRDGVEDLPNFIRIVRNFCEQLAGEE